jgi:hypothetical protein
MIAFTLKGDSRAGFDRDNSGKNRRLLAGGHLARANLAAMAALILLNPTAASKPKSCFNDMVIMKADPTE